MDFAVIKANESDSVDVDPSVIQKAETMTPIDMTRVKYQDEKDRLRRTNLLNLTQSIGGVMPAYLEHDTEPEMVKMIREAHGNYLQEVYKYNSRAFRHPNG